MVNMQRLLLGASVAVLTAAAFAVPPAAMRA
jgi:hypothetical protein